MIAPRYRRLRVYAFDPIFSRRLRTASSNVVTLRVPWEEKLGDGLADFGKGPVGEYIEVVDYDPSNECFYEPIDLNDPHLIAQDGLAPSEGNPQFHQQMVYAVAMQTIKTFERALGRRILWSARLRDENNRFLNKRGYVPRLRIYPHALREANAYYSPRKKALLFGYTPASSRQDEKRPGMIFTCLSQDIIAHEMTHAILDGIHRSFTEPSNCDVLAFHEAFSDCVALLQRFSLPGILDHEIAENFGDLSGDNRLAKMASEVGKAMGKHGALRDALGQMNPKSGRWEPRSPNPEDIQKTFHPHERGAILVAAFFRTFVEIYQIRTRDLRRIASGGTGILQKGALHPDLVSRLSKEARKAAEQLLNMCIRALDYCPPVDITFGDFLRAIITADTILVPDDDLGYRIALLESFEQWGLYPENVTSLSVESLVWPTASKEAGKLFQDLLREFYQEESGAVGGGLQSIQKMAANRKNVMPEAKQPMLNQVEKVASGLEKVRSRKTQQFYGLLYSEWDTRSDRKKVFEEMLENQETINSLLTTSFARQENISRQIREQFGFASGSENDIPGSIRKSGSKVKGHYPAIQVNSVRWSSRESPDGDVVTDLIVEITQTRMGYFDEALQRKADKGEPLGKDAKSQSFKFRGGCTLIIDPETAVIRYVIKKDVEDQERLRRQRAYRSGGSALGLHSTYESCHALREDEIGEEPFGLLHKNDLSGSDLYFP